VRCLRTFNISIVCSLSISKVKGGMPVAGARHAIGVVVICSIVDRVLTGDGGHLVVAKGGYANAPRPDRSCHH
jgi:hypothetical protein